MNKIQALVSDLDGTLLNADHSVPPQYCDLYKLLVRHDIRFIVASARPLGNIQRLFENYPMPAGVVACDGAIVAAFQSGNMFYYTETCLSREHVRTLFFAIKAAGVSPILFLTREHNYSVIISDSRWVEALRNSDPTRHVVVMEATEAEKLLTTVPVRALSAFSSRADIAASFREVASIAAGLPDIRVYSYDETRFGDRAFTWLDVVSYVNRKEEAIEAVLRSHGIAGCEFVACGNGENDTAMLAKASFAYCPINSVPSVQRICSSTAPVVEGGAFVEWVLMRMGEILRENERCSSE